MMGMQSNLTLCNFSSEFPASVVVYANTSLRPPAPPCADWPPVPMTTVIPTIYSFISVLGIIANALAVIVLGRGKASRGTVANTFMLNLCVSDLLFLLSLPLWAVYYSRGYSWIWGQVACKICGALHNLNLYASIFFITCMSMDRYLAIVHPLRSQTARYPRRAQITCALVWVLACACSAPTLALRDVHYHQVLEVEACVILYPDHNWFLTLVWMKMILGFLLPFFVISCCYFAIGRHLLAYRSVTREEGLSQPTHVEGHSSQQQCRVSDISPSSCGGSSMGNRGVERILWTVAAVVIVFFLFWFPFHCITFLDILNGEGWLNGCWVTWSIHNLTPLTLCLGFSSSAVNPVLYCFIGNRFRRNLGGLCKGLCAPKWTKGEEHSHTRGSFSTRLSSFSRKLSDLKELVIVETSGPT